MNKIRAEWSHFNFQLIEKAHSLNLMECLPDKQIHPHDAQVQQEAIKHFCNAGDLSNDIIVRQRLL